MIPEDIGAKLHAAREEVSMSYQEAYEESKITPEEIKSIENGEITPSPLHMECLCYAYGISTRLLLETFPTENIMITHNDNKELKEYLLNAHALQQELDNLGIPENV